MILKSDARFEKNWFVISKMTRIWWILTRALKSLKNLQFDWFLLCKIFMFDLKKNKRVIFHDTEEWCKVWRKTDLRFGKWHEEYGKFSPKHLKFSKLGLWCDPLIQGRKRVSLEFTEDLCVRMMKNMRRNCLVVSKATWGIWQILTWGLKSPKNFHFNGLVLSKADCLS